MADILSVETYPGAQSVSRAVALLKAFSDDHPEWMLSDLSDALGLNKTTAHRLLTALEGEGLLLRDPDSNAYRLGPEIIALGASALRSHDLRRASRSTVDTLAQETGETASLEILVRSQILVLDEISQRDPAGAAQSVGVQLPIHATSTGKLLLAHLPDEEWRQLLPQSLSRYTPRTVTDPVALAEELALIRGRGYAVADGELEVGFVAMAAPVYDQSKQVIAALSIGGPALRLTQERQTECVASLQVAARRLSRQLGYRPG